jgi:hypothetical protein
MRNLRHRERRLHQVIGGVLGYTMVALLLTAVAALADAKSGWGLRLGLVAMLALVLTAGARLWFAKEAELWILAIPMVIVTSLTVLAGGDVLTFINAVGLAAVGFLGQVRNEIRDERQRAEQENAQPPTDAPVI